MSFDTYQSISSFVDEITNPNQERKSEIFKISSVIEYLTFWSTRKYQLEKCTICQLALNLENQNISTQFIGDFMTKSDKFAQHMPENMVGVMFTWMFMAYIMTNNKISIEICISELDPMSILFHNIIGWCKGKMGTESALHDLSSNYTNIMLGSILRNKKKYKNPKKVQKNRCDILKIVRFFTKKQVERKKKKIFPCTYDNYCLYSNDGCVHKRIKQQGFINDCRIYISDLWVEKVLKINYSVFLSEEFYEKYFPGVYKTQNFHTQKATTNFDFEREEEQKTIHLVTSCSFIANSGDTTTVWEEEEEEENKKLKIKHQEKCKELVQRLVFLQTLSDTICDYEGNETSPITIVNRLFPICKWCTFCVEPRMRMIINDVYVMSERKATKLGIGSEHGIKITPVSVKLTDSSIKYSLGFSKGVLSIDILKSTFLEWIQDKYPWLQPFVDEKDVLSLQKHKNPKECIECAGNVRRLYTESDRYLMSNNFRCFIIHGIKIINKLINLDIKLKKDVETIETIARDHHIPL